MEEGESAGGVEFRGSSADLYRANLQRLEESAGVRIMVSADPAMGPGQMRVVLKAGGGTRVVERSSEEAE